VTASFSSSSSSSVVHPLSDAATTAMSQAFIAGDRITSTAAEGLAGTATAATAQILT
jgi:hypothetical protein